MTAAGEAAARDGNRQGARPGRSVNDCRGGAWRRMAGPAAGGHRFMSFSCCKAAAETGGTSFRFGATCLAALGLGAIALGCTHTSVLERIPEVATPPAEFDQGSRPRPRRRRPRGLRCSGRSDAAGPPGSPGRAELRPPGGLAPIRGGGRPRPRERRLPDAAARRDAGGERPDLPEQRHRQPVPAPGRRLRRDSGGQLRGRPLGPAEEPGGGGAAGGGGQRPGSSVAGHQPVVRAGGGLVRYRRRAGTDRVARTAAGHVGTLSGTGPNSASVRDSGRPRTSAASASSSWVCRARSTSRGAASTRSSSSSPRFWAVPNGRPPGVHPASVRCSREVRGPIWAYPRSCWSNGRTCRPHVAVWRRPTGERRPRSRTGCRRCR